ALPFFGKRQLADALVKLVAYFIADGGLTDSVPKFTNAKPRVLRDFSEAVAHFPGLRCRLEDGDGRTPTLCVVRSFDAIRRARQAFAERLRTFLGARRMSLAALARTVGVTTSAVHQWTTGAVAPGAALLPRLRSVGFDTSLEPASPGIHKNGNNPVTQ